MVIRDWLVEFKALVGAQTAVDIFKSITFDDFQQNLFSFYAHVWQLK